MGKDKNLVEKQTPSSEFYLSKRHGIYGFGALSLSLSLSLSLRGVERLLRPPLDPPLYINRKRV